MKRPPDFIIGEPDDPYIHRWWVIPRNRWFNIYLHKIMRSDDDRALHDHPWWNVSVVLRGGYMEHTARGERIWRGVGSIVPRGAITAHRLEIQPEHAPIAWTLFLTGPRIRTWGFHCPQGWVPWFEFVSKSDKGSIGRGCGEQTP